MRPKLAHVSEHYLWRGQCLCELQVSMEKVLNFSLNAVRLQQAVLCVDCNVISDSPQHNCLVCGSGSLLPLARVLDRPDRASVPAMTRELEKKPEVNNVLVLVPAVAHRRRQTGIR